MRTEEFVLIGFTAFTILLIVIGRWAGTKDSGLFDTPTNSIFAEFQFNFLRIIKPSLLIALLISAGFLFVGIETALKTAIATLMVSIGVALSFSLTKLSLARRAYAFAPIAMSNAMYVIYVFAYLSAFLTGKAMF